MKLTEIPLIEAGFHMGGSGGETIEDSILNKHAISNHWSKVHFILLVHTAFTFVIKLYLDPWDFLPSLYFLLSLKDRGVTEKLDGCLTVGWSQSTTASVHTLLIFKPLASHNNSYVAIEGEVVLYFHLYKWHMVYIFPVWAIHFYVTVLILEHFMWVISGSSPYYTFIWIIIKLHFLE